MILQCHKVVEFNADKTVNIDFLEEILCILMLILEIMAQVLHRTNLIIGLILKC